MMQIDKNSFSAYTVEKNFGEASAPKTTIYADFKICIVLKGEAVWEIDERSFFVKAGDVVFLNIGQKRRLSSFGKDGFKLCALVLTRSAFASAAHFDFFLDRVKRGENLIRNSMLFSLLEEVYLETSREKPFGYSLISAKLTEFFIKAERIFNYSFNRTTSADKEMLEVMSFIDEGITEGMSLSMAAEKAGLGESTFSRRFLAMNGISFKRYLMEKKTKHAIKLMNTTNLKVIDIALESGFDSISGFYDAFKKITGTTPKNFKKGKQNYETEI